MPFQNLNGAAIPTNGRCLLSLIVLHKKIQSMQPMAHRNTIKATWEAEHFTITLRFRTAREARRRPLELCNHGR